MSRNIKEIGKELMGKSLNSFHRKTGLTQLEENNKMQDGILDGILSQVDDAYIDKTEQSNVIHLDGSGDGVVVLDGIEGNTMVNLNLENKTITRTSTETGIQYRSFNVVGKPSTVYTLFINITKNTTEGTTPFAWGVYLDGATLGDNNLCAGSVAFKNIQRGAKGVFLIKFTSRSNLGTNPQIVIGMHHDWQSSYEMEIKDVILLEGDWTNKEIPSMFEGLQSSFEEKVNDEGKYEIEILSHNKNILDIKNAFTCQISNWEASVISNNNKAGIMDIVNNNITVSGNSNYHYLIIPANLKKGVSYYLNYNLINAPFGNAISFFTDLNTRRIECLSSNMVGNFVLKNDCKFIGFPINSSVSSYKINDLYINVNNNYGFKEPKHNKIKLLLNEPLRSLGNIKDVLCVKDNKLVIERKCAEEVFDGSSSVGLVSEFTTTNRYSLRSTYKYKTSSTALSDKFPSNNTNDDFEHIRYDGSTPYSISLQLYINKNKLASSSVTEVKKYLQSNPMRVVGVLAEPIYEEVTNEYGEPILLEGYENGTIYIDSTIVPTTTVRYTPKMESFKTLKEVEDNNIMLTNDVNDNIIPYMMDVDLMIMEREMALPSKANIRRIGAKDMTSMQKRTQDMLERLIKGKTLTEQECKTRVVTYLDAGKITDEQADELMLLISEVYA